VFFTIEYAILKRRLPMMLT